MTKIFNKGAPDECHVEFNLEDAITAVMICVLLFVLAMERGYL